MVVGFNHNFSYKGQVYHVQTEDSGVKNPHIITLLYRGGTILASKKTSYADIIKVDNLETVVEDLMKAQHREMLKLLKNGDFDNLLDLPPTPSKDAEASPPPLPAAEKIRPPTSPSPTAASTATEPQPLTPPVVPPPRPSDTATAPAPTRTSPLQPERAKPETAPPPASLSLDDIILSYMVGEGNKK